MPIPKLTPLTHLLETSYPLPRVIEDLKDVEMTLIDYAKRVGIDSHTAIGKMHFRMVILRDTFEAIQELGQ